MTPFSAPGAHRYAWSSKPNLTDGFRSSHSSHEFQAAPAENSAKWKISSAQWTFVWRVTDRTTISRKPEMKKLHSEQKQFLHRRGVARWNNTLSRKNKTYNPYRYTPNREVSGKLVITAPTKISIYDFSENKARCPYYQTLRFTQTIKSKLSTRDCIVDFSSTTSVSAAALVIVYAALETAISERMGDSEIVWSKNEHVNRALKAMNINKIIDGADIDYNLKTVKILPIISSVGKKHMESIIDFIKQKVFKDMSPVTEHVYADAISETINNVGLHAYPDGEPATKRWWLMCNTIRNQLYLAIYDCGIGIPKTVMNRTWFIPSLQITHPKLHKRLLEEFPDDTTSGPKNFGRVVIPDERLIHLSMMGDVTGTEEDKHGQGSKSIMKLVGDTPKGKLWVFSNNGLYTHCQSDNKPGEKKLSKKFPGTLVQWNIKLS